MDALRTEVFCGERGCALPDPPVKREGADDLLCPTCNHPLHWREVSQDKPADPSGHGGDVAGDDVDTEPAAVLVGRGPDGALLLIDDEGGASINTDEGAP